MKMKNSVKNVESYRPTIWRTCRVLANTYRLKCLKIVLGQPFSTVGEIAEQASLSMSHTSQILRALQARGLIAARRKSRWVYYVPSPDPLVIGSRSLLAALRRVLVKERKSERDVMQTLTAFTHVRRLEILRLLQRRSPLYTEDIHAITKISAPALSRHLRKLSRRHLVVCNTDNWSLIHPNDSLARTLLKLLCSST